jgi:serine/threonine-protein kinase
VNDHNTEVLGRNLGHIRIIDLIGEGGMGAVYVGFDDTLKRKVAVKAIRSEFRLNEDTKSRFLREARILSQLNHPNICTVYDFVEEEATDYLVLELVEGENLRDEIEKGMGDDRRMSVARQILRVLVAVHGRGVMHRDLKPENVMLTADDTIKVLDFGLARSVEEEPAVSSAVATHRLDPDGSGPAVGPSVVAGTGRSTYVKTRLGTVVGTAGYMSPEQARGEPATAASDMYSLGLILQELFTGEPPFEPGLSGEELLRKAAAGASRPVTGLPPDLTALIERLKAPAPGARPSSVDALAELERIRDAPRRRRRRTLAVAAWAALALLTVGMTVQSIRVARQARRANQEAGAARRAQSEAEEVSRFLVDLFEVSDPSEARGETITARELLDRGAQITTSGFEGQPLARARFMRTIGAVYLNLGLYDRASPLLEDALTVCEEHLEPGHPEIAGSLSSLAALRSAQGRFEDAIRLIDRELEIHRSRFGPDHPDVARCLSDKGRVLYKQGQYGESEACSRAALEIRERIFAADHLEVARSLTEIGALHVVQGRSEEAEECFERALAVERVALGADHPEVAKLHNNLGVVTSRLGRNQESIQHYQRCLEIKLKVYGPDHPSVASTYHNIAENHRKLKQYDQAEDNYRRAFAIRQRALPDVHPEIADSLDMLGVVSQLTGRFDEAEELFQRALDMRVQTVGHDHPRVALTLSNLGYLHFMQGRYVEAEPLLLRALDIRDRMLGPENPAVADTLTFLGSVYAAQGRFEEAEPLFARLLALREKLLPADHPYLTWTRTEYAAVLRSLGHDDRAAEIEAGNDAGR